MASEDLKPEEKARVWIDDHLRKAGWRVIDRDQFSYVNNHAVAVRESIMKGNKEADYILFLNNKACAVLEAKRAEVPLDDPELIKQAENYTRLVPSWCPAIANRLPYVILSNGRQIAYRNANNQDSEYELAKEFPTPKVLCRELDFNEPFAALPTLERAGLRACQYEAITNLEASFRNGQKRALMVMATGSGKTFTACLATYRLLEYCKKKRVLFLVDRTNLGEGAKNEFGQFKRTNRERLFTDLYGVEILRGGVIHGDASVVVSTIQGLYAALSGKDEAEEVDEFQALDEDGKEVQLPENPKMPPDFFDVIIVDECHRSIYGLWKQVLNYFEDALLIGLTATPIPQTVAFFNKNRVINYTLEKSIVDGVNVDCRIYRVKTEVSENGVTVKTGEEFVEETKLTGEAQTVKVKEEKKFEAKDINRSVIVEPQIRAVLEHYKEIVATKFFPDREFDESFSSLPKTLIFCANEKHAQAVTRIAREVFGHTNPDDRFAQQITYSAKNPNALIRDFRSEKDFRIATTVTLVATGTDIRALEVIIFLTDVRSENLYVQMKGRGVRTISDDVLRLVTPNATTKDFFYLLDAVGVTESEKGIAGPVMGGDGPQNLTFKLLFEKLAHGYVPDDLLQLLAGKLSRLLAKAEKEKVQELMQIAGFDLYEFAKGIYDRLKDVDNPLPPFVENEENRERKSLIAPLINNHPARKKIVEIATGYIKYIRDGEDVIVDQGFSKEAAQASTQAFERYIEQHKDDIEALRLILNGFAPARKQLEDLRGQLASDLEGFSPERLWANYRILQPEKVKVLQSADERAALTNIIQLVRFAKKRIDELFCIPVVARQRFSLWCGQKQRELEPGLQAVFGEIAAYIAQNGALDLVDVRKMNESLAISLKRAYGTMDAANAEIHSLAEFILKVA